MNLNLKEKNSLDELMKTKDQDRIGEGIVDFLKKQQTIKQKHDAIADLPPAGEGNETPEAQAKRLRSLQFRSN